MLKIGLTIIAFLMVQNISVKMNQEIISLFP